jgi:Mrp family chromosome partitioning ATPase
MSPEIIEQSRKINARTCWRSDAEVSGCFRALYRRLLLQSDGEQPVRLVAVTSCRRGEGVSTVASRLAIAAADEGDQKVLLVDANLEAPSVHRAFAIDQSPGLLNVAQGSHSLEQVLQSSSLENLWLLPLGTSYRDSPSIESPSTVRELLSGLAREFSFIVVDMASFDQSGDPLGVTTAVDGILLVVEADRTKRSLAYSAADALSPYRLLGTVLNKQTSRG